MVKKQIQRQTILYLQNAENMATALKHYGIEAFNITTVSKYSYKNIHVAINLGKLMVQDGLPLDVETMDVPIVNDNAAKDIKRLFGLNPETSVYMFDNQIQLYTHNLSPAKHKEEVHLLYLKLKAICPHVHYSCETTLVDNHCLSSS
jgi:uncharacterized membrane protein YhfC